MEAIKLLLENKFFVLIVLGLVVAFLTWYEFKSGSYQFKMLPKTPVSIKILITVIAVAIAVASMFPVFGSVNPASDIQNQTLYKNKNESLLVFNLDKVGHSIFSPVISFYVFKRLYKQNIDIYVGRMEFPRGSETEAYSGNFKDYSVHGVCEGEVTLSSNVKGGIIKSFKLEFNPKIESKNEFCKEDEAEVTKHSSNN